MLTTDYYKTGKLYPKLDAYTMDNGHYVSYLGSSRQFKTMKSYKSWLMNIPKYAHLNIKIVKAS